MSQTTGTEHPAAPGADATVIDLAAFMDAEALDRVEQAARVTVQTTPAGIADLSTGTVSLSKDDDQAADEGGVFEQLDELDEAEGNAPALRPILPATFTDPAVWRQRRAVAVNAAGFHTVRSPWYFARSLKVAAIGAKVAACDAWSYTFATEYGELADKVRRKKAGAEHVADLREDRRKVASERRHDPVFVYSASAVTGYAAAVVAIGQAWSLVLVAPALLPLFVVLYVLGRRELVRRLPDGEVFTITDAPEAGRAPLGADTINDAFRRAGLIKADEEVSLVGPVRAVAIHAAEAVLDLPGTLTLSDLIKERERLAKGFRVRPEWIDLAEAGDPGRVRLWVASEDPFGKAVPSPLITAPERTDVWNRGILIGFNRRGIPVFLKLRHVMALLGGMSRTGKGMLLRNLICGLGLDPRVNLRLIAGAKPGEHRGYAPVCSTFFGRRPERLVAVLDGLLAEAYRREDYLEEEGRAKLGEKDLDRFPLEILIIDEYKQYAISSARIPDPSDPEGKRVIKAADRIAEQLEELAGFAAALNITVLVSTQDPDAGTIPRQFKSNSGARVATRTGGPTQTNAILKEGATGAGLRAHDIPESLKGGAIVDIDGAPGELIRSHFIEDEEYDGAAPIIEAGVALREGLGRLPGQFVDAIEEYLVTVTGMTSAAGGPTGSGRPGPPAGTPSGRASGILAELLAVFEAAGNPERLRTAELLDGLAERDPERWGVEALGVEADDAAAYVRVGGGELRKAIDAELDGTGRTLAARGWSSGGRANGYYREDVLAAAGIVTV